MVGNFGYCCIINLYNLFVMEIKVIRKTFTNESTIGELSINGKFFCYTLEDFDRDINKDGDLDDAGEAKVYGLTAIPKGTYKVILSFSNRFQKYLPEVLNVKGFEGIRIHAGNKAADSHGCILLGATKSNNFVGASVATMTKFMAELKKVEKTEKITLTIL
jgi:hypothetical protein